jgi:hypothetical protein
VNAFWNVVAAEAFKLVRKRRVYVLAGLWWLLLPTLALIVGRVLVSNLAASFANEVGGVDLLVQTIASPFGIALIGVVGPAYVSPPFYVIVVAALAAVLIGEERSHKMWKTVLVAQPSRPAVLAGKLVTAMLLVGVLLGGALLSGFAFGAVGTLFLPTSFAGDWGGLLQTYLLQWAFTGALVAFAFLMVHRRAQRRRRHDPGVLPAGPAGGPLHRVRRRRRASSRSTASTCSSRASGCGSCSRTYPPTSSRPTCTRRRGHRSATWPPRSPPRPRADGLDLGPARQQHHARTRGLVAAALRAALRPARLALPARRHRLTPAPAAPPSPGALGRRYTWTP